MPKYDVRQVNGGAKVCTCHSYEEAEDEAQFAYEEHGIACKIVLVPERTED